jgi:hypothetical protein
VLSAKLHSVKRLFVDELGVLAEIWENVAFS